MLIHNVISGCTEANGMLNAQFIPMTNIALRDVTSVPEKNRNVFLADPAGKARIDSILGNGRAVEVTKVELISELGDSEFRIKYKGDEADPIWLDYTKPGEKKIAVCTCT
jgi:hypothetical protein